MQKLKTDGKEPLHSHHTASEEECLGAIYHFFLDLTSGNMKINGMDIPFGLYVSTHRRRQILQSMMIDNENEDEEEKKQIVYETDKKKDEKRQKKKDGEKILTNFKKSLAEQKAREEAEKPMSQKSNKSRKGMYLKSTLSNLGGTQYSKKS